MNPTHETFPNSARVVVIGGGILGCSTAYHLAREGCADVVVLERSKLTSGTTWHAAGLVRRLRASATLTRLIEHSIELYSSLEAETGQATGWNQTGSLSIAASADRMTHLKRQISLGRAFGLEAETVDPARMGELWPRLRVDDLVGGVFSPHDGRVNPSDVALALSKGARARGVRFIEDTVVTGIEKVNGRTSAVTTSRGRIDCETVVICAGLWSREVAALAGANAPLYACEHYYILTKPIDGFHGHLPTLGAQDDYLYARDDVGGLLVGSFEPDAKPLPVENLPNDFSFDLLNEDWDHFEPMMRNAIHRIPALATAEVRMLLNGPESFTLDGQFMLGESAEVPGLFLGCGMNSVGIASAGGAGRALAEWILAGEATMDLVDVDVRRFAPHQNTLQALHARIPEVLGKHYEIAYPGVEPETLRGLRRTALHDVHAGLGGRFAARGGWERAEVFAAPEEQAGWRLGFGRPPWLRAVGREYEAAKSGVAILDQSPYGKIMVQGGGAEAFVNRIFANQLAVAPGRVVYTSMLNRRGGIESDVTVQRWGEDQFLVITGAGQTTRDLAWLRDNLDAGAHITLTDVTSAWSLIGLAGPKAETLLSRLTPGDVSPLAFPRFSTRELELGMARVRVARLSYTGEPGFELLIPTEMTVNVHQSLRAAGEDIGVRDIGTLAVASLRIENGMRAWGHELSPGVSPLESGLERFVAWDKPGGFIGRDALLDQRRAGIDTRVVGLAVPDHEAVLLGGEPILGGGRPVGQVTSAAHGYAFGHWVALGHVRAETIADGAPVVDGLEVEIACQRTPVRASLDAPIRAFKTENA